MEYIMILMIIALLALGLCAGLFAKWVWPYFAVRKTPAADVMLIKVRLGGEGHRVVDVTRWGQEIKDEYLARGARIVRVFRIYRVEIQYPDRSTVMRDIGVACTLFGAPYLVTYESGRRKGLWTHHQASLA